MLRYKTKSRPGLVALYDIRPGNGAGPFLECTHSGNACKQQVQQETPQKHHYTRVHCINDR